MKSKYDKAVYAQRRNPVKYNKELTEYYFRFIDIASSEINRSGNVTTDISFEISKLTKYGSINGRLC